MRRTAWLAVVIGALFVTLTPAAAQTVPLPDAEDVVNQTVDTATSTVNSTTSTIQETTGSATGSSGTSTATSSGTSAASSSDSVVSGTSGGVTGGTSGGVTDSVSGTAGAVTGTGGSTSTAGGTSSGTSGGTSTRSGSGSGGGKAAAHGTRQRTAFDRLPRRFELLLERIEFGRNVRANLLRLEQALASATPEQRARILRLLKTEIKHLRKGGLTAGERARINRLQRALKILTRPTTTATPTTSTPLHTSPNAREITATTTAGAPAVGASNGEAVTDPTGGSGGVLGTQAGDGEAEARPLPVPLLPDRPEEFPLTFGLILLGLAALGFAGIVVYEDSRR